MRKQENCLSTRKFNVFYMKDSQRIDCTLFCLPTIALLEFSGTLNMASKVQQLKTALQLVAFVIFLVQMGSALRKYLRSPAMITSESTSVYSMTSPIQIAICRDNPFNFSNDYGYTYPNDYFVGNSGNDTYLSWAGKNGQLTIDKAIDFLFISEIDRITDINSNFTSHIGPLLPFGACKFHRSKPKDVLVTKRGKRNSITIVIEGVGVPFHIYVFDPLAAPNFQLPMPLMTGEHISVKRKPYVVAYSYNIVLKETRNKLKDGSCAEYPDSSGHKTYTDCVETEIRGKILPVLGCMPPWMSDKDQCTGPVLRPQGPPKFLEWFNYLHTASKTGFFYQSESCLLPCSRFSVNTILIEKRNVKNLPREGKESFTVIDLFVEDQVQVDTAVLAVGLWSLTVEIGKLRHRPLFADFSVTRRNS